MRARSYLLVEGGAAGARQRLKNHLSEGGENTEEHGGTQIFGCFLAGKKMDTSDSDTEQRKVSYSTMFVV